MPSLPYYKKFVSLILIIGITASTPVCITLETNLSNVTSAILPCNLDAILTLDVILYPGIVSRGVKVSIIS